jgi:hypothetical protein
MVTEGREPRELSRDEAITLAAIKPEEYTLSKIKSLIATQKDSPAAYLMKDRLVLNPNECGVKVKTETTVGRVIFNRAVLQRDPAVLTISGFRNEPMNSVAISRLDSDMSSALLDRKITPEQFIGYVDRMQWFGFGTAIFVIPTITSDFVEPLPEVRKRKAELLKQHMEALSKNDIHITAAIEKELLDIARGVLKDKPSYQIYESGAKGSFGNNYKNMSVMRGSVRRNGDGKFKVVTSSLAEGIRREDYATMSDLTVTASYGRSVQSRDGGYEAKKLSSAFQTATLGPADSDCKTTKTVAMEVTPGRVQKLMYRWIVVGGKTVIMDQETIKSYVGKTVQMRTPMYCLSDQFCSKCAGDLYYRLGISDVGLMTTRVGTRLLNLSLKAFHDSSIKTKRINIQQYIG